jgi:hypothetical protein
MKININDTIKILTEDYHKTNMKLIKTKLNLKRSPTINQLIKHADEICKYLEEFPVIERGMRVSYIIEHFEDKGKDVPDVYIKLHDAI